MTQFTFLTSIDDLRTAAPAWNDLWQRSDCTSPLARAEMVADWMEHYAPQKRFRAAVVVDNGRWLAALPLIDGRAGGMLRAGVLPCNEWPSGATLLCDVDRTAEAARTLVTALAHLPWRMIFLEAVMPARASWHALCRALTEAGVTCDLRTRWRVPWLPIEHDWPASRARLSRKHRQRIAAALRKLSARGKLDFQLYKHLAAGEVEPLVRRAFAVEDRGWKGAAGTSILRTPGAAEFMFRQARQLAADDRLWLAILQCGGRDAAFCYGPFAKGVLHSLKIGYDAEYAAYSPGHLLQYHLLEALHADAAVEAIDYIGAWTEYHASWRPKSYPFARLAFAPRGNLLGQAALWSYQWANGPTEVMPA